MSDCYCVVAWADIDALSEADKARVLAAIEEGAWATVRHSATAPDEIFMKCSSDGNCVCVALEIDHTAYTHAEALALVADEHWEPAE